jgi:integrase
LFLVARAEAFRSPSVTILYLNRPDENRPLAPRRYQCGDRRAAARVESGAARAEVEKRRTVCRGGLAFMRGVGEIWNGSDTPGLPLAVRSVGGRQFQQFVKRAGVKRVTFHALRHTSATLLLLANVSPKIVSERLGHTSIAMTLDIYSHLLPSMGRSAADQLGALLHGA